MSKKLILLVLAIVSSALVFGCNTAEAGNSGVGSNIIAFDSEEDCEAINSMSAEDFALLELEPIACIQMPSGRFGIVVPGTTNFLTQNGLIQLRGWENAYTPTPWK